MTRRGLLAAIGAVPPVHEGATMSTTVPRPMHLAAGMPCPVCRLISPPSEEGTIEPDEKMATYVVMELGDDGEALIMSSTRVPFRLMGKHGILDPVFRIIRGKLKELRECENCGAAFWQEVVRK